MENEGKHVTTCHVTVSKSNGERVPGNASKSLSPLPPEFSSGKLDLEFNLDLPVNQNSKPDRRHNVLPRLGELPSLTKRGRRGSHLPFSPRLHSLPVLFSSLQLGVSFPGVVGLNLSATTCRRKRDLIVVPPLLAMYIAPLLERTIEEEEEETGVPAPPFLNLS